MTYMLLVYLEECRMVGMGDAAPKGCDGLAERLMDSGNYVSGGILQPTLTATTLRVREGQRMITDGPFAETREQLAGFLMVEAEDLDVAMSIAAEHPVAQFGSIEIRPLREVPLLKPMTHDHSEGDSVAKA